MTNSNYPYVDGDPLSRDKRYSYSKFQGSSFLQSWDTQRQSVVSRLPAEQSPPEVIKLCKPQGNEQKAGPLLDYLFGAVQAGQVGNEDVRQLLDALVKRLEVFRRVHGTYRADFRALDTGDFHNLGLYVRAAEVFEAAHAATGSLTYLNVLLKTVDSICALLDEIPKEFHGRTARLINCEAKHISALAQRIGVDL